MVTSLGTRRRCQLARHGSAHKELYRERTATERIFSQAVDLSIEHPKLRNSEAIANLNTLIYTLINLRTLVGLRHGSSPTPG